MYRVNIPKKLWQIWIGPKPAPTKWMDTWKAFHPDWEYTVIDNEFINNYRFYNQHLIDEYINNQPWPASYAGAADLIRYEILHKFGGFIPEADAVCLHNTDNLWTEDPTCCYTVYENETLRPTYVSPINACNPGNQFLEIIIEKLHKLTTADLKKKDVYLTTGNGFLPDMIKTYSPKIKIFPSHYFIPTHYSNQTVRYTGNDIVYAEQNWGTTNNIYHKGQ